jgi:hypothetical protein
VPLPLIAQQSPALFCDTTSEVFEQAAQRHGLLAENQFELILLSIHTRANSTGFCLLIHDGE